MTKAEDKEVEKLENILKIGKQSSPMRKRGSTLSFKS